MIAELATRRYPLWLVRVLRIALFTVLIAIAAKISIPIPGTPVPITMQTLAILVTGMVLGPIEGVISVAAYVGAIALNLPLDALSIGTKALFSPTAGYLIGFIPGVIIAGLSWRIISRYKFALSLGLGFLAVIVIFVFGVIGLLPFVGSWTAAIARGAIPFIFVDLGKVLLAASLVKLGRESWLRWIAPLSPGNP